jgi:hypothetical protein
MVGVVGLSSDASKGNLELAGESEERSVVHLGDLGDFGAEFVGECTIMTI